LFSPLGCTAWVVRYRCNIIANEIGENKLEIIRILEDPKNTTIKQSTLASVLDISQQAVSNHLRDLEELGLLDLTECSGSPSIKELTREGYKTARGGNEVVRYKKEEGTGGISKDLGIHLHKFYVKFKIRNRSDLSKGWLERHLVNKDCNYVYDGETDSYRVYRDGIYYRVSRRHVFVKLENLVGHDVNNLKSKAMVEAYRARDWLEDNSPVRLHSRPIDAKVWTNSQHISILKDPFAMLVKENSSVDLNEVKVYDSDGNERLKIDQSTGVPELESESVEFGEDDIDLIKEEYRYKLENPDDAEYLYREVPDEVKDLREEVSILKSELKAYEDLEDRVEELESQSFRAMVERVRHRRLIFELEKKFTLSDLRARVKEWLGLW